MVTPVTGGTPYTVYANTPTPTPTPAPASRSQVATTTAKASAVQDTSSTSPAAVAMILSSDPAVAAQVHTPIRLTEPPFAALRAAIEQALMESADA